MSRRVKDFIEIKDISSLDALIEKLIEIRDSLPPAADAKVKMRGDDIFGRQLAISFFRPQTADEAEYEARYAAAYRESREKELSKLQEELGMVCRPQDRRRLRLAS
jgi:hypothetical protein